MWMVYSTCKEKFDCRERRWKVYERESLKLFAFAETKGKGRENVAMLLSDVRYTPVFDFRCVNSRIL